MQKVALSKELGATTYPGRGIVIGKSEDGKYTIVKRIEVENKDDSLKMKNYVEGLKA